MVVKVIPTSVHAIFDYGGAALLLAIPWLFDLQGERPAIVLLYSYGVLIFMMSAFTNYEGGLVKALPFDIHLYADIFGGAFLAASPWLFKFADKTYAIHLAAGLFIMIAGLTTRRKQERHEGDIPDVNHVLD